MSIADHVSQVRGDAQQAEPEPAVVQLRRTEVCAPWCTTSELLKTHGSVVTTDPHAFVCSPVRELAEFTIPKRSSASVIELEVLLYIGAALVHKHSVQLAVLEGPGASAKVTFSLVHVFARLPVLIDRVASIDVGPDHLTVNAIGGAGTFTFRFSDTNWSPVAVAVRKALTALHFRKVANGYQPYYPDVAVPTAKYRESLLCMAKVGRQLYNQIFNTAASAGLAPLLRHEAEARDQAPVVQIARTAQRPFAVPWQVLYDLPMEHPDEDLVRCPSVDDYGPGGTGTWPPPAVCPNRQFHERAGSAILCPWGFWGLAHVLEVPEPPPGERSLDQIVSDGETMPTVLVGTGS
ncbi:MAG: hypothetical protein ACRDND_13180, partial [Streptosporangiaceae bacterium]